MKQPFAPSSAWPNAPAPAALQLALRKLYRSARHISYAEPYAAARLARIADQAEYFLNQWPAEQWPARLHAAGQPLPARATLLTWLTSAKQGASQAQAAAVWSYAAWQQVNTTLLAALVPFT